MASVPQQQPEFKTLSKRVLRFDGVTSFMMASTAVFLMVVIWLAAVWVTNRVWPVKTPVQPVEIIEIAVDEEEGMAGDNPELGDSVVIDPSEVPAYEEALEAEPEVADLMSSVLEAIAELPADPAEAHRQAGEKGGGTEGSPGGEGESGTGSGSSAIPRAMRWSIAYGETQSLIAYARVLDFFKIELGVVPRGGGPVTYVSNLSRGTPIKRVGGDDENRLYFAWQGAGRRKADIELLEKRAKVSAGNKIIVQFVPRKVEDELARLEKAYKNRQAKNIRSTRFGVRQTGTAYEFYVINQVPTKE